MNITNKIFNYLYYRYNVLSCRISTFLMYFQCSIQNIHIGKKCRFYGNASFCVRKGGKISIGKNVRFRSKPFSNSIGLNHSCMFSATPFGNSCKLEIGDGCGFSGTAIWCFDSITIGNNVRCGANTLIMDGDAHFDDPRTSPPKSIIIKDNVFLGANVVVKKGVTIGENSVVGMNSVVTKDIPANCVAVGNPCRIIKQL